MQILKIYIADDHQMIIDGIRTMLSGQPGFEVCGESNGVAKALEDIQRLRPDIVISDVSMPDVSGIVFCRELKKIFPGIRILILSMFDNAHIIQELRSCGISGYILKNKGHEELLKALHAIAAGGSYYTEGLLLHQDLPERKADTITPREKEIIKLIAAGLNSPEIAARLFISEHTVETHRRNIFRKTNTHSAIELINLVREKNLWL